MHETLIFPAAVAFADGAAARDHWPLDPAVIHLNHGSFGAVPSSVIQYQEQLRNQADRNPIGWFPRIAEHVHAARHKVARFVGAAAGDTAFVPNASAAATVVYNSLRLDRGDEILVTDHGYGAVTMGARRLAARFGARLRTVEIPLSAAADEVVDLFRAARTTATRLIVVDQITSSTARQFPTAQIARDAAEHGIRTLIDGAHAPGLIPDAAAVAGGDWWFGNLHKWPCAPRGAALLVTTAPDRDELWPLIDSWGADEPYPARFDTQGTIDATSYIAAPEAVALIDEQYGWSRARATVAALADAGAALIAEAFAPYIDGDALPDVGMPISAMRLIRLPDGVGTTREQADDLRMRIFDELAVETAFTSFRDLGYFRLSMHLYNTAGDIAAFIDRCVPKIIGIAADNRRRPT